MSCCSLRRRVPLRGTSILRLRRGPFGFIGRRLSGQARHLFGWSQTRESLCRTPVSKGLLVSYAILYFHSQPAHYIAYECGKALSTSLPLTIRSSALHSCHTDRSKGLLIWHAIPRAPLISKLATLLFYDAPHQNLEPINLNPYAFTASHAMSER